MSFIFISLASAISSLLLFINWFQNKSQINLIFMILGIVALLAVIILTILEKKKQSNLLNVLIDIKTNVDSLSGVSDQISNTSSNMSEGSLEQAEGLQQTSSAMEEIRATVERNRDFTDESKRETESCLRIVKDSTSIMNNLQTAFKTIKSGNENFEIVVKENNQKFDDIKKIISEISEKTQVINDIVFQTKLLAFNASVEAARAGEHGKGFSVVAEEVGSLASMSGKAADEISDMLEGGLITVNNIVDETTQSVERLVKEASSNIEKGENHVENSLKAFKDIEDSVSVVTNKIFEISQASQEQTIGVEEISKAINVLEQNTQRSTLVSRQALEISHNFNEEFSVIENKFNNVFEDTFKITELNYNVEDFQWSEKFEIGVDKMDEEHQILIQKINRLVSALNGTKVEAIKNNLYDLRDYTLQHFEDEERYMESVGYPDLEAHKKIHKNMVSKFLEYQDQFHSNSLDKKKFIAFLKNWLISHILGVDKQYAEHSHKVSSSF